MLPLSNWFVVWSSGLAPKLSDRRPATRGIGCNPDASGLTNYPNRPTAQRGGGCF